MASDAWPVHDIVYTAIVGLVMVAACLEWFLWLAAFLYCLWKVFRKAEHWTVRVLAVVVGVAFSLLRCIFLPIMIVTLPLPRAVVRLWPPAMVSALQWFAFWSFAGLLTIPWLFCVYQVVTHQLGRTKRIKQVLDEASAPKIVVVMPCYREEPAVLLAAINSVVDCDYPPSCIHVFLSFDGDQEDELYLTTLERLGVPLTLDAYPASIDVPYRAARVTVSRFPHGGKRHCQKATFRLIDRVYHQYLKRNDNLFILFIDSDCVLDRVCLQNFVYDMELSPGNRRDMLAMTGVITSTTQRHSLITLLQDMEYVHGQLFERTVESGCGAVTCLPGALTMLRFSAFRRMAKYYFADKAEQCEDLFDFAKCHLGEDRWLTHLFMIGAKKRHQIQMCTSAFCKTEAVQTVRSLVKQRRRWFLGFLTNEVCMLTDWRLWKRYPVLVLVRFMQNTIRTTALLFFIMVLALLTTSKKVADLPVGFIAVSLGLNWLLMVYFGVKLRRYKIMLYPLMFLLNPFFNWYYMVYGIFTAGQRTWGGPRADAAAADGDTTTVRDAIEQAEQAGDDLNIVPESFGPAAAVQRQKSGKGKGLAIDQAYATSSERRPSAAATRPVVSATRPIVPDTADSDLDGTASQDGQGLHPLPSQPESPHLVYAHEAGPGSLRPFALGPLGRSKSGRGILQPPDTIDGMFSAPERTASGWYHYPDDSLVSLGSSLLGPSHAPTTGHAPTGHHHPTSPPQQLPHPRDSVESFLSSRPGTRPSSAVYLSRRVESLMSDEDRRKFELAQASQMGGASGSVVWAGQGHVYEYPSEAAMQQAGFFADSPAHVVAVPASPSDEALPGGQGGQEGQGGQGQGVQGVQPNVRPGLAARPSPLGRLSYAALDGPEEGDKHEHSTSTE